MSQSFYSCCTTFTTLKKKPLFDTMSFHTKLKEKAGKYFVMLFAFFSLSVSLYSHFSVYSTFFFPSFLTKLSVHILLALATERRNKSQ